ncbi:hypothetical protein M0R45_018162 [Rubus argutus]|uniref:Secreted protein n=1 Tax=Rubus argutus TaxID=59490 RepID=A0AAW1X4C5_RUBAR
MTLQRLLTVVKLQSMGTAWVMRTGDALGAEGGHDYSFMGWWVPRLGAVNNSRCDDKLELQLVARHCVRLVAWTEQRQAAVKCRGEDR